jgi:hypothetical protein
VPVKMMAVVRNDSLSYKDSVRIAKYERKIHKDSVRVAKYEKKMREYVSRWNVLIPTQTVFQYAGNMGLFSVGIGWNYGKRKQWETNLLVGYLPKYSSSRWKVTMTLKENYIPWKIPLNKQFAVEPLSCGLYVNTVFGNEFWGIQPKRYPYKYYEALSTKARINVFLGERFEMKIPENRRKFVKAITAFYEISTCDLYIRSMIQDSNVKFWDIVGLSLGLKFQLL